MHIAQTRLSIATAPREIKEITAEVARWTERQRISVGLLTLYIPHTSAPLLIQENASPDVRRDLDAFLPHIVRGQPATSVRGEMLLVSLDRQELSNREAVDAEARELVLDAYRSAKISISDPQSKFNAALKRYCKTYPLSRGRLRDTQSHISSRRTAFDGAPAGRATAIWMARRCVWGGEATKIGRGRGRTGTDFGLAYGGVGKPPFCGRLVRRG